MNREILSTLLRGIERIWPRFNSFSQFGIAQPPISYRELPHYTLETEPSAVQYLPGTIGAPSPFFADYLSQQPAEATPFVATLERGVALFDGAHLTEGGKLIEELSPQFGRDIEKHRLFALRSLKWRPKIEQVEATVVSLAGRSSDNYFHWLWDLLPRIALLKEAPDFYYIDHSKPWQKALLQMAGVDQAALLCPHKFPIIQAKRLVVPSYPDYFSPLCPWVGRFFQDHFSPDAKPSRRFYISRKEANWRYVLNEEELLEQLEIEPVVLEKMETKEQIKLFQEAELIISPHGAGLANLAFCQKGTRVIEIFAETFLRQDYWRQSELMGLHYTYLRGEGTGKPPHRKGAAYDDVVVPIEQLLSVLRS